MNNRTVNWIGCLLWILIPLGLYLGCEYYNSYRNEIRKEKIIIQKRNDSIRKAYILDSLANDPHYQDSLYKAEIEYQLWKTKQDSIEQEEIIGYILLGRDSCYHNTFHDISIHDKACLRFLSKKEADERGYCQCSTCDEIITAYDLYESGELMDADDIDEYIKDNIDDYKELFEETFGYDDYFDDDDRYDYYP